MHDPERPPCATTRRRHGFGRCEVVCFTSDHGSSLANVAADAHRPGPRGVDRSHARALARSRQSSTVFIFENRGVEIGVTLSHPHGQIYAYPFVPPRDVADRAQRPDSPRAHRSGDLFDDVIARERSDGVRIVAETEHWIAFVPRAARWPFEFQIFTKRRTTRLPELTAQERAEFAAMYLRILQGLDAVLGVPMPYIAAWHQAPVHCGRPRQPPLPRGLLAASGGREAEVPRRLGVRRRASGSTTSARRSRQRMLREAVERVGT